ncbi:MAG: hypothetical protein V4582_13015 [Pseudomonadota bacterium]
MDRPMGLIVTFSAREHAGAAPLPGSACKGAAQYALVSAVMNANLTGELNGKAVVFKFALELA